MIPREAVSNGKPRPKCRNSMKTMPRPTRTLARIAQAIILAAGGMLFDAASANIPCDMGGRCGSAELSPGPHPLIAQAARVELATTLTRTERLPRRYIVPPAQYRKFSGVGAVVCSLNGKSRTATAFLVGRFDIAVTVAHTFLFDGEWAAPEDCAYISSGPRGQIRERIPIAELQAQWRAQPETLGQPDSDLAVIRLSAPARVAQRTLSFSKFSSKRAPVALVGFPADVAADAARRKTLGSVYQQLGEGCAHFTHDADSRWISAGAPIIDVRDGVVIGIHTKLLKRIGCAPRSNAMLIMNQWLLRTLREAIASDAVAPPNHSANGADRQAR
jgi:hypothetical protein